MPELGVLRVVRYSAANAWADLRTIYTPWSWTFGWLGRVIMQVIFYALIGVLLDSPQQTRYLFVGTAVAMTATEALMCIASSSWERRAGTLSLLVAAPTRLLPVFFGRSLQWVPSGVATASVTLFVVGPWFGLEWTPVRAIAAVAILLVVGSTTYCLGLALSALVLQRPQLRNVVSNVAATLLVVLCGVTVPVSFWPGWVGVVAQTLPLTHGLAALRPLAEPAGRPVLAVRIGADCCWALLSGAGWLAVAALALEWLVSVGRRTGSIDFPD